MRKMIEAAIAAAEVLFDGGEPGRQEDIGMFVEIVGMEAIPAPEEVPFSILAPVTITSELKSAFVIAFMIYIPFIVIDLIVARVDVDGYDDVTNDDFDAIQVTVVRFSGWLDWW